LRFYIREQFILNFSYWMWRVTRSSYWEKVFHGSCGRIYWAGKAAGINMEENNGNT
jgi:hypothetical protein